MKTLICRSLSLCTLMAVAGTAAADEPVADVDVGQPTEPPAAAAAPAAPAPTASPAPATAAPTAVTATVTPSGPRRDGFTIGFAVGFGSLRDEDDEGVGGASVSFRLGAALSPRFLLQGELAAVAASEGSSTTYSQGFRGVSALGFVSDRVYLGGGVGQAVFAVEQGSREASVSGVGVMFAFGVEVHQTASFAIDLETRAFAGSYDGETITAGSLMVGFQWY